MSYVLLRAALIATFVFVFLTLSRRARFRFIIISSALVSIVALYLWGAYEAPSTVSLLRIEGKISESYLSGARKPDILFRIGRRQEVFRYKRWFPRFGEIETQLRIGNRIDIEYSVAGADSGRVQLWQIESDGRTLVSRQEITQALNDNARYGLYVGVAFGIITLSFLTAEVLVRRREKREKGPEPLS